MSCQLSAWLRTPPAAALHNYNIVKSFTKNINLFFELKFAEDNAFKVFRKIHIFTHFLDS